MIYQIMLESIGEITLLPDSQKLFGFLMSKLSERFTGDEVSSFVNDVYENKTKCMVSNLLPEGYMPFPTAYILDSVSDNSKDVYKLVKKIDYIDEKSLVSIIKYFNSYNKTTHNRGGLKSVEDLEKATGRKISFVSTKQSYLQKFKLESQEKSMPGLPNKAYSLPILNYYDRRGKKCDPYSFFVQTDGNNILALYFKQLYENINMEKEEVYGLGAKASHGYNTYALKQIKRCETVTNGKECVYINMGMLIPKIEKINDQGSFLDICSSNRKSYEISDNIEKVISFIIPGSVINPKNKDVNVGRCIINEYNIVHKNAIIFGNSFIKKIEVD